MIEVNTIEYHLTSNDKHVYWPPNSSLKEIIDNFYQKISEDPRISPVHVSLYLALLNQFTIQGTNPIYVFGKDLMENSKISGGATYHKAIRDLNDFGYIRYIPSYYHLLGSLVYLKLI
ncbi:MAG: hypothetical protein JST75_09535 [Bacteroidetes bacterium]|nr:hypothetical protein [Bacteroidota bacterium]